MNYYNAIKLRIFTELCKFGRDAFEGRSEKNKRFKEERFEICCIFVYLINILRKKGE